jgi:hypothetical protein
MSVFEMAKLAGSTGAASGGFDQPPQEPSTEFLPLKAQRRPQERFGKPLALAIIEPRPRVHRALEQRISTRHLATFQNCAVLDFCAVSANETQKSRIAKMPRCPRSHVFHRRQLIQMFQLESAKARKRTASNLAVAKRTGKDGKRAARPVDDRRLWRNRCGGRASTYRRTMWRMRKPGSLIFVALVVQR